MIMKRALFVVLALLSFVAPAFSQVTPVRVVSGNTYSAAVDVYTGYANPTDIVSIVGSAQKVVKIVNIRVSGYATANDVIQIDLVRRSAADTGGTPTIATNVPLDTLSPAATAVVTSYASAPGTSGLIGNICACQVELPAKAGVGGYVLQWDFNENGGSPLVLRGAAETVALNLLGATLPSGGTLNITIRWVEE
jgi:hypothetical protein